jgi:hypothetical protein
MTAGEPRPGRPMQLYGYMALGAMLIIASGAGLVAGAALNLFRRRRADIGHAR